ncbi:MAG TPA: hypothetical protein VF103_03315, partial [Polyangiaceae bacterium]
TGAGGAAAGANDSGGMGGARGGNRGSGGATASTGGGGAGGESNGGEATGGESTGGAGAGAGGDGGDGTVGPVSPRTTIDTETQSVCAVVDGSVRCWGDGDFGALGDGIARSAGEFAATPVTVENISDAVEVEVGAHFACALRANRTVECWGAGGLGQLGDGDVHPDGVTSPQLVPALGDVLDLAVGYAHACALLEGGRVKCWGGGGQGELGNGERSGSPSPVDVVDLGNAVRISAGGHSTCAVLDDTSVSCWGDIPTSLRPMHVSDFFAVDGVSVGTRHVCALKASSVWCWGQGDSGQLGNEGLNNHYFPVLVRNLPPVVSVTCGMAHTCALLEDRSARCWGGGVFGELGDGVAHFELTGRIETVMDLANATEVTAGGFRTCARVGTKIFCWGNGGKGSLGDGDPPQSTVPLEIDGVVP